MKNIILVSSRFIVRSVVIVFLLLFIGCGGTITTTRVLSIENKNEMPINSRIHSIYTKSGEVVVFDSDGGRFDYPSPNIIGGLSDGKIVIIPIDSAAVLSYVEQARDLENDVASVIWIPPVTAGIVLLFYAALLSGIH